MAEDRATPCRPRACWCWRNGDLTMPSGRGILALLSGLAEEERTRIHRRASRIAAIKRGIKLGRKFKLSDHQQAEALKRLAKDESCRAIRQDVRLSSRHGCQAGEVPQGTRGALSRG